MIAARLTGNGGDIHDAAFKYPIKLIVNALGVPPKPMMELAKKHGVMTGALVGAKEHAAANACG